VAEAAEAIITHQQLHQLEDQEQAVLDVCMFDTTLTIPLAQ
jgi:hypothetical protein